MQIVLIELCFIECFRYGLILNYSFIYVNPFTNFLTDFIKRKEKSMSITDEVRSILVKKPQVTDKEISEAVGIKIGLVRMVRARIEKAQR